MEDREIVELYWERDERAISESDAKYGNYCFTVASNILSRYEDAEECVNDTWLRAWNAIPPKRPSVLRTFFAKITRNLALDQYRKINAGKRGGGQIELVLDELSECVGSGEAYFHAENAGGLGNAEEEIQAKALQDCIRSFVESLPERDGNIFIRRYFYAEKTEKIAGRYGLTPNNVGVVLSRTRKKLYEQLRKEGFVE